jgi:hypothetical protein
MSAPPRRAHDFTAEIRLLPECAHHFHLGGLRSGFRAAHDFHRPEGGLNDGMHVLVDRDFLPLGTVAKSEVWLLAPEQNFNRFYLGFEFDIYSPTELIGNGFIVEIHNEKLAKKTQLPG